MPNNSRVIDFKPNLNQAVNVKPIQNNLINLKPNLEIGIGQDQIYYTTSTISKGQSMGLLLALTYPNTFTSQGVRP